MKMHHHIRILSLSVIILAGCQPTIEPEITSTPTQQIEITPYVISTATPSSHGNGTPSNTVQPQIPSPTPFTHTIQSGDTLFGIALLYNISLDRLVAANPGINSSLLTIGTEIIIPGGEEGAIIAYPTPTPYPIVIEDASCLSTTAGELWCFPLAINQQEITLENLSALITLYDAQGAALQSVSAIPPLTYLYPGQSMPLQGIFTNPIPEVYQIEFSLLTSLPVESPPPQIDLDDVSIDFSDDRQTASINGSILIPGDLTGYNSLWIAAVGYQNNQVVGIRKWVSDRELTPGSVLPIELLLYSLGPGMDEVQVSAEYH